MSPSKSASRRLLAWSLALGLLALLWSFWTAFADMSLRWGRDPEYSHGYLVPFLALVLLWYRYDRLQTGRPRGAWSGLLLMALGIVPLFALPGEAVRAWGFVPAGIALIGAGMLFRPRELDWEKFEPSLWGLPLLVAGIALRIAAVYYYYEWFDYLSLLPCLAGVVLLTFGRRALRWSWPAILFLVFMIPLPHTVEGMLREPLRKVGTVAGTFVMQTVGLPAAADGNRHEILVGGMTHRIGVDEACSGLSMLMIFFALCTAVAVVIKRPFWEKVFVVVSAVPIALIANVLRISTTGVMLYELEGTDVFGMTGTEFAQSFFHDWAGWMMMPLALGLLWIELWVLKRIIVIEEDVPLSAGLRPAVSREADSNPGDSPPATAAKPDDKVHATSAMGQ